MGVAKKGWINRERGQVSRAPSSEEAKGVKAPKFQAGGDTPLATTAALALSAFSVHPVVLV